MQCTACALKTENATIHSLHPPPKPHWWCREISDGCLSVLQFAIITSAKCKKKTTTLPWEGPCTGVLENSRRKYAMWSEPGGLTATSWWKVSPESVNLRARGLTNRKLKTTVTKDGVRYHHGTLQLQLYIDLPIKTPKKQETSALIWTLINDYICEYFELPVQRDDIAAVPLNVKNMLPIPHNSPILSFYYSHDDLNVDFRKNKKNNNASNTVKGRNHSPSLCTLIPNPYSAELVENRALV